MHPSNHTPTHEWGILHRFQIFKQNQIILIHSSVMEFLLIPEVLSLGKWQVGGLGWGWVWECGVSHACTSMHTHACCKHDKHGCLHVGSHLQFLYMYTCLYVCVHVCVCAYVWGHPHAPRHPHPPAPQSHREPKTPKFNKS